MTPNYSIFKMKICSFCVREMGKRMFQVNLPASQASLEFINRRDSPSASHIVGAISMQSQHPTVHAISTEFC